MIAASYRGIEPSVTAILSARSGTLIPCHLHRDTRTTSERTTQTSIVTKNSGTFIINLLQYADFAIE